MENGTVKNGLTAYRLKDKDRHMHSKECTSYDLPMTGSVRKQIKEKIIRTQTGAEVVYKQIVHCGRHCQEFVIASPRFSIKRWLLLTIIFNLIGFLLELHERDSRIMTGLIVLLVVLLVLKLHLKVKRESLLIMGSIGVQLTTTFASGRSKEFFYDIGSVRDVIINEGITMHRVIFYLALMLRKDPSSSSISKLVPIFKETWPSVSCLTEIYQGAQSVLHGEQFMNSVDTR